MSNPYESPQTGSSASGRPRRQLKLWHVALLLFAIGVAGFYGFLFLDWRQFVIGARERHGAYVTLMAMFAVVAFAGIGLGGWAFNRHRIP